VVVAAVDRLTLFMAVAISGAGSDGQRRRLSMTNDLTERMVGHRTRLAQEAVRNGTRVRMKNWSVIWSSRRARTPRRPANGAGTAWLVGSGTFGLTWAFVASEGLNIRLAISLGGILLAYRALKRISQA